MSENGKALGGLFAANFSLYNIMQAHIHYKCIKGCENTENWWIINVIYAGPADGNFNEPMQ